MGGGGLAGAGVAGEEEVDHLLLGLGMGQVRLKAGGGQVGQCRRLVWGAYVVLSQSVLQGLHPDERRQLFLGRGGLLYSHQLIADCRCQRLLIAKGPQAGVQILDAHLLLAERHGLAQGQGVGRQIPKGHLQAVAHPQVGEQVAQFGHVGAADADVVDVPALRVELGDLVNVAQALIGVQEDHDVLVLRAHPLVPGGEGVHGVVAELPQEVIRVVDDHRRLDAGVIHICLHLPLDGDVVRHAQVQRAVAHPADADTGGGTSGPLAVLCRFRLVSRSFRLHRLDRLC